MRRALLMPPVLVAGLTLVGALVGCEEGGGEASRTGVEIRVEGGVTIVENAGLHEADTSAWSIDTTDVVRIGELEGPEEYTFGRVAAVTMRADGTVLVGDRMTRDVRAFDLEGRFLERFGGPGEGPGEFAQISALVPLPGDSVAVIGASPRTVDLFGPSLEFARRVQVTLRDTESPAGMAAGVPEGLFSDGRLLLSEYGSCGASPSLCVDSAVFHRTNEEGLSEATYGRFVHGRTERVRIDGGPTMARMEPHPQAFWATRGTRFYYADAQRFEIRVYGTDGSLERRIRVAGPVPRYTREEVFPPSPAPEPTGNPSVDRVREAARAAERVAEIPDTFPAFSDMLVDDEGNVWVREYLPPSLVDERGPHRWYVFDPEGRLRWSLRSAPGMVVRGVPRAGSGKPLHIGSDHVVARVEDELGVESVVVYRLEKEAR